MSIYNCEAFAPKHSKFTAPKKANSDGSITPQEWQTKARVKLSGERFRIVSAPCGSGKSIAILLTCIDEILFSKYTQKQLIVVPQKIIGQSFTESLKITNGKTYTWLPAHNFIDHTHSSVIKALRVWLLSPFVQNKNAADPYKIEGINAVCSHQALAIVWQQLTKSQKAQAIHRLTISIDEAHHVRGVFDEINGDLTTEEMEESNHLGDVVHAMVNSKDTTAKVTLGTATFYRGDAGFILHESVQKKFVSYIHSWVEHWPTLNLNYFRMEYRFYHGNPIDQAIQHIKSDPKHIYFVYIPATGNAWRRKNSLKQLMSKIYTFVPAEQVLDLVTKHDQRLNTQRFRKDSIAIKKGSKPSFRVIVACGIGLEGMDYPPASRLLNLACQNSVTRAVQVIGRPMRKFDGKSDVYVYNYVSAFVKAKKGVPISELLADRTNAILTCMAWHDFIHPVMLSLPKVKGEPQKKELSEVIGHKYQSILASILEKVEMEPIKSGDNIKGIVTQELAKHKLAHKFIIDGMIVRVIRALLKAKGTKTSQKMSTFFDVTMLRKSGFNILKQYDLEHQTIFFGDCTQKEWEAVRNFLDNTDWAAMFAEAKAAGI